MKNFANLFDLETKIANLDRVNVPALLNMEAAVTRNGIFLRRSERKKVKVRVQGEYTRESYEIVYNGSEQRLRGRKKSLASRGMVVA